MKTPIRVAVTGPAGNIGYSLLFRIASGAMFGADQPVILQLLERNNPDSQKAVKGVMMELDDCAFPLLAGVVNSSDPKAAFRDADVALLVGARPRSKGMERADLLDANAAIFVEQGRALDESASRDVKVLVVGNPCNTNAWIAMKSAPSLPAENFTSMLRLDQNRLMAQIAAKSGKTVNDIVHPAVWGNHSPAMVPDLEHAQICGRPALEGIDRAAHSDRREARLGHHRSPRRELGGFRRLGRDRPHPRLGAGFGRPLGDDGRAVRRLLRRPRRPRLRLPLRHEERQI